MHLTDDTSDARRMVEICNACRYCENFCAVFPAIERHREFTDIDLTYLSNLCHNCQGCYYSCQYAPPHEWGVNLPATFTKLRYKSYEQYAWPGPLAASFRSNGVVVSLVMALCIAALLLIAPLSSPAQFNMATAAAPGGFYKIIPLLWMQSVALAVTAFCILSLGISITKFWRDISVSPVTPAAFFRGVWSVLTLKNLSGAGHGCNDKDESFSMARRRFHHAMFYGFLLCFASTTVAFIYNDFLNESAPYALMSAPVILGTLGGISLFVGAAGLFAMKFYRNPDTSPSRFLGADIALLLLLALAALTGLLLLALRDTTLMGVALAVHLGIILAFFLAIPYSKMVHGLYRFAALVRNETENCVPTLGNSE